MSLEFARVTFRIAMSPMTGAEMVVMRRRTAARRRKRVPTWWRGDVRAIFSVLGLISVGEVVLIG